MKRRNGGWSSTMRIRANETPTLALSPVETGHSSRTDKARNLLSRNQSKIVTEVDSFNSSLRKLKKAWLFKIAQLRLTRTQNAKTLGWS